MPDKYHALRSVIIASLLPTAFAGKIGSAGPTLTEQTLETIQKCMAQSPTPWPDEWKQEYIDTIHKAVELYKDSPHYAKRLEILRKGFAPCWENIPKTNDKSLFEVYRCRIRWHVEHLMESEFPTEQERQKLCDQFTDIWDYAASSLLKQFPFLDPNAVQKAKQEDLSLCYRKIETPLMPVYLKPMSEEQVGQIKQRWDKLRYVRVDLWHRLGGGSPTPSKNNNVQLPSAERDYELTKECMSQLLGLVWIVVPERPDYYVTALNDQSKAIEERMRSNHQARRNQQRLEKECSRQLLQTEHISFMWAALLETMQCLDGAASVVTEEQDPLENTKKNLRKEVVPMR